MSPCLSQCLDLTSCLRCFANYLCSSVTKVIFDALQTFFFIFFSFSSYSPTAIPNPRLAWHLFTLIWHTSPIHHTRLTAHKDLHIYSQTASFASLVNKSTQLSTGRVIRIPSVYHLSPLNLTRPSLEVTFAQSVALGDKNGAGPWTPAVSQVSACVWLHHLVLIAAPSKNWQDFQQKPECRLTKRAAQVQVCFYVYSAERRARDNSFQQAFCLSVFSKVCAPASRHH